MFSLASPTSARTVLICPDAFWANSLTCSSSFLAFLALAIASWAHSTTIFECSSTGALTEAHIFTLSGSFVHGAGGVGFGVGGGFGGGRRAGKGAGGGASANTGGSGAGAGAGIGADTTSGAG